MFLRALIAFLALPGMVAFVIPAWWLSSLGHEEVMHPLGFLPFLIGVVGLLWCVRDFYVAGKGTLAPWSPPKHLVVTGPFRWSRNPIYVAMLVVLIGWAVTYWSRALAVYTVVMFVAFHIRTILGEEPRLAREFGEEWRRYVKRVPRWIGLVAPGGES
jgi:protein-S-isoprenylcysteine O-methyltransferase Ste14